MITRRRFLQSLTIGGAATALTGFVSSNFKTDSIEVAESTLVFENLPEEFRGYRIAFVSDLHLGGWVPNHLVDQAVALTNRAEADLVLLGGDHIWVPDTISSMSSIRNDTFRETEPRRLADEIFAKLSTILSPLRARDGVLSVCGNHDHWASPDACEKYLPKAGIRVLGNEVVEIRKGGSLLRIIGTEDYWTGIPSLPKFSTEDTSDFRILITHNPDYLSYALALNDFRFELGLAGHTHGGQVKLPIVGALTYNIQDLRFKEGHVTVDRRQIYTTRGIGVVEIPFRLNCPPEVAVLTLDRA